MSIPAAMLAPFLARAPGDFDLDFRNGIYRRNGLAIPSLAGVGGFSHTQSGSCWEIDGDGDLVSFAANAPRVVPGLGLWARTTFTTLNSLTQQFDNASWGKTAVTVSADAAVAPDGTTTMDKMVETATSASHEINRTFSFTTGQAYTLSVVAKAAERSKLRLAFNSNYFGSDARAFFDLTTGTAYIVLASAAAKITALGNGHYLCSITATCTTSGNGAAYYTLADPSGANSVTYTGDGSSGLYLWQGQAFAGSQCGPLIVATSSTASNGAAQLAIPFAQRNEDFVLLASFNMAEGSTAATRTIASLAGPANTERVQIYLTDQNTVAANIRVGDVAQNSGTLVSEAVVNGRGVAALRYRGGKFTKASQIGAGAPIIGSEGPAVSFPELTRLHVGHITGGSQLNGIVERTRILRGTYDDTALGNLITAMAA